MQNQNKKFNLTIFSFNKYSLPFALFTLIFAICLSNLYSDYKKDLQETTYRNLATSSDIVPNTFLPYILVKEQSFKLNSITQYIRIFDSNLKVPYYLIRSDNDYFSAYPVITAIVAVPFYLIPVLLNKIPALQYYENVLKILALGRITASFYTALSAVIFYFILNKFSDKKWEKVVFTLFFALGTTLWSISSRGLWQHTISGLFIVSAIYFLISKKIAWGGVALGLAVATRPTNIFVPAILGLIFLIKYKKFLANFLIGLLPGFMFMLIYNWLTFGSPIAEGYGARNDFNWSTPLFQSLPGFAFSPARSFLFISPPLILGFIYFFRLIRKKSKDYSDYLFLGLWFGFLGAVLLFAKWYAWSGANGFGYRMLTDFVPIVALFSFFEFARMRKILQKFILVLMIYSIVIHANAVFNLKSSCSADHNWDFQCLELRFFK